MLYVPASWPFLPAHELATHTPALPSPTCSPLLPAGWDLAVKLLCQKNRLNRGRLSAGAALRHPFLLLPA
jgi:hypothetical protein